MARTTRRMRMGYNLNLIRSLAWSYHRTTGIDFNDLFSEACIAYLQAMDRYDPARGVKETTFLYHIMTRHLNLFIKKYIRYIAPYTYIEERPELIYPITPFDIVAFHDEIEHLSINAQTICGMIFSAPAEYCSLSAKGARGHLKDELRNAHWSWSQIWDAFREIKLAVSNMNTRGR